MLPDIRAVIATIAAAIGLLMISFGLVATFRVAQDSRAASLQADLAQRGRASPPQHRPIGIIETPGPTLAVIAPVAPTLPGSAEPEPADVTPAPGNPMMVAASEPAPQEKEPVPENKEPAPVMAAVAEETEAPPPPAPPLAIGGPSPEEVAQADAEHQTAERAKAKKAAAEKAKTIRAARIARERKAAARRAAQARARAQQQTNSFNAAGTFNNAPFGNSFGGFENSTRRP